MKTLALIGVGRWGKNIISTLEKIPEANLKYLCAASVESLVSCPTRYEKLLDWRELPKKKDLDAVLIATPAGTHAEIATAFLQRGIGVFSEKPMVLRVSDAKKLRTLVKKSGAIFMVGYQYVYNDYIRFIKKEIKSGLFGKITEVISEQALIPEHPDVDVFWDAGPHPLSIFQYLFGPKKLVSIKGKIRHDSASMQVQFEKTPALEITTACAGPIKTRKLTVTGEKATAVLDETLEKNKLGIVKNGQTSRPEINLKEPLRNELEHFIHCLETGETPLTNVDFGCQITEWLETVSKKLK